MFFISFIQNETRSRKPDEAARTRIPRRGIQGRGGVLVSLLATLLFSATAASCSSSDSNDEAAIGALAYLMTQSDSSCKPGGIGFQTTGSSFSCSSSGVDATSGSVSLYSTDNVSQDFLSLEVTFTLADGGSMELMGAVTHGDQGSFSAGHGMKFTPEASYFQGSDGTSVVTSSALSGFVPGTTEHTVCFELHMDETPAHIVVNYTNGGCTGLNGISSASTDSEDAGFTANTASVSSADKPNFGVRLSKGSIKSIVRNTQAHFSE